MCSPSGRLARWQQPAYLAHHSCYFFLICKRYHKEFVALMEAQDTVCKKPHAFEKGISAKKPANRCSGDRASRVEDLRTHRSASRATECAEKRSAYKLHNLALEPCALSLRFAQIPFGDKTLLFFQI